MYSTKTATTNNQEFNSAYMPVGINENITLKEVNVNKTPNGRDFLEIIFENNEGQIATMTEWKNEKNIWIKTDEDLQRRDDIQFGRVLQIINCFGPTPEVEINNFVEMINWVKTALTPYIQTKTPLRLKVVYDKKGYVKVSSLGVFVEPMSITETQMKMFANDLTERPIVADKEPVKDPLIQDMNIPVTSEFNKTDDELPF